MVDVGNTQDDIVGKAWRCLRFPVSEKEPI